MAKIEYTYFECPEADCPMMAEDGMPYVAQIAEGERRRCPCEKKIKLKDEHIVPPPARAGGLNRRALLIGGGGALILLLLLIWWIIPPPPPRIEVDPVSLDFGATPAGSERILTVTVRNKGKGELQIDELRLTGDVFAVVSGEKLTLKKGESDDIEIVFRPTDAGNFEEDMAIDSNDPKTPIKSIKLTGSVARDLEETIREVFEKIDSTSTILRP